MLAYNISLIVVRVLAAISFVSAGASALFACVRLVISLTLKSHSLTVGFIIANALPGLTFPFEYAVTGILILIFAKSIARFASKLASPSLEF